MKGFKKAISVVLLGCMVLSCAACGGGSSSKELTMGKGETYTPSEAQEYKKTAKYKSSNKKVAVVNKKGTIKAKKLGKATVTGTKDDNSVTYNVTVVKAVKKVKVAEYNVTMYVGDSYAPVISFKPKKAGTACVTLTSSNENVIGCGVDDGKIYAYAPGFAEVTVTTNNNKKTTFAVNVLE